MDNFYFCGKLIIYVKVCVVGDEYTLLTSLILSSTLCSNIKSILGRKYLPNNNEKN